ncbi:uncharacterized protein LOC122322535 [Drosophila grimshawi]|uniref:uncharacterized protein LOC122322535 n=1 Tax=Drosophila grimshawi TaxID=7222 RepID=UPI001C936E1B|nr:uncharacterized protein LOC122322535 [Drosophila grimshawi]
MHNYHSILIVLLVCLISILCFNEAAEIKFTNVICTSHDESWLVINTCRLRALNRNRTILNANATLLKPINEIIVDLQIFQKANGYKPWLFKFTLDFCRFLRKAYNPVAIMLFKLGKEFTNFNHSCPYKDELIIDGLYLLYEKMPIPWPAGEFLIQIKGTAHKKKLVLAKLYFYVIEDF